MPEAVTYRVSTYYKLAKDETGLTQISSLRLDAAGALQWVLSELPDDAWDVERTRDDPGDPDWDIVTIKIDWTKVPDSIRAPKMPAQRRR
jgi:hypothetical protein